MFNPDKGNRATSPWDCEQNGGEHTNYPDCCRSYEYLLETLKGMGEAAFSAYYQQAAIAMARQ